LLRNDAAGFRATLFTVKGKSTTIVQSSLAKGRIVDLLPLANANEFVRS